MTSTRIRRLLVAPAVGAVAVVALAGTAWATDVTPVLKEGNPSCADLDASWTEGKLDFDPAAGTYTRGDLVVTITKAGDGSLGWTSNLDIDAVIMKGGPNANVYLYPDADGDQDKADTGLVAPENPNGKQDEPKNYGISHVTFCRGTTTTPNEPNTPTTPVTPNTPATPQTPAPQVEATVTPAAEVAAEVQTQVLGTTFTAPEVAAAGAELPRTGVDTGLLAILGTSLIVVGGAAIALSGRGSAA